MLQQLFIQNFVLIDSLALDFPAGFSAFTGETGAGKSILIDAISLLCGERSKTDYIRHGQSKALIEGVFELAQDHKIQAKLAEYGYEMEDGMLILTRELYADGKSVARIQHRTCSLSVLKELGSQLVDIHSQHDNTYLLDPKQYLRLLDQYQPNVSLMQEYHHIYEDYNKAKKELDEFYAKQANEMDTDILQFQKQEIEQVQVKAGEIEELEERIKLLSNLEKIQGKVYAALTILQEDPGIVGQLYQASKALSSIHESDEFSSFSAILDSIYYQLQDCSEGIAQKLETLDSEPGELDRIQERLFAINKLRRKYGGTWEAVERRLEEINRYLSQLEHRQEYVEQLEQRIQRYYQQAVQLAQKLSAYRKNKAQLLEKAIKTELNDLYLPNATFQIAFDAAALGKYGMDQVSFLVSMNKGEQVKPLDKTASGGELSRFMLGLKVIFTKLEQIDTVIFDEIDTGISGPTAFAIGKKMRALGFDAQVFSVTHLAQVAASAPTQYYIHKFERDGKTVSAIVQVKNEDRIRQLALLASGNDSDASKLAAQELFALAQKE